MTRGEDEVSAGRTMDPELKRLHDRVGEIMDRDREEVLHGYACPLCSAAAGSPCRDVRGRKIEHPHAARVALWHHEVCRYPSCPGAKLASRTCKRCPQARPKTALERRKWVKAREVSTEPTGLAVDPSIPIAPRVLGLLVDAGDVGMSGYALARQVAGDRGSVTWDAYIDQLADAQALVDGALAYLERTVPIELDDTSHPARWHAGRARAGLCVRKVVAAGGRCECQSCTGHAEYLRSVRNGTWPTSANAPDPRNTNELRHGA